MATSPHQTETLPEQIARLKAELASYRSARDQVLAIGQSTSGGGTSTTYTELARLEEQISWRENKIQSLTAQLVGDDSVGQPGVVLTRVRSDYR